MSNVQLPGSNKIDSQMKIHTGNQIYYVSLAKEFQHHLTKEHNKNGVFDQVKNNKRFTGIKWTERQYCVQDNADVERKYMRVYRNTNQLPSLPLCGPHSKPHCARGTSILNSVLSWIKFNWCEVIYELYFTARPPALVVACIIVFLLL